MSGRGSVITVVEDDVGMAKAIERLLRAKGFSVEVFDFGRGFPGVGFCYQGSLPRCGRSAGWNVWN